MSLRYTLRESLSGFKRTKLSSAIAIMTICISLLLLGVFAVVSVNTGRFMDTLRGRLEIEAFLREPLVHEEVAAIQDSIARIPGVERVLFVSKDDAAKIFKQEFGEDISTVLDFNPLPPSFKISLHPEYRSLTGARGVQARVARMAKVDQVVFHRGLLEMIEQRTVALHNISLGLGILISLSAVFLVSNTIRLAIYAKRRIIRTMELVGATRLFIRIPFLLEGMLQGLVGGLAAALVLYLVVRYGVNLLAADIAAFIQMPTIFYLLVVVAGGILGLLGSVISVARFIQRAA